jgi:hypothetical protein
MGQSRQAISSGKALTADGKRRIFIRKGDSGETMSPGPPSRWNSER